MVSYCYSIHDIIVFYKKYFKTTMFYNITIINFKNLIFAIKRESDTARGETNLNHVKIILFRSAALHV